MSTCPPPAPAGFLRSVGSPPAPDTRDDTAIASNPSSATRNSADTGPGAVGVNVSNTVQSPPGGTGAPNVQVLVSSLTAKRPSDTVTTDGTNDVGPLLITATYHSSLCRPTSVVPRSTSGSDRVGSVEIATTWRPAGEPGTIWPAASVSNTVVRPVSLSPGRA